MLKREAKAPCRVAWKGTAQFGSAAAQAFGVRAPGVRSEAWGRNRGGGREGRRRNWVGWVSHSTIHR